MLVGNSSQALFLVHSESVENPFVNPRPFRVNAGPVHAYIRLANGQTKYLSEVRAGDQVLVVNFEGKSYPAVVGRAKVERRPLVLVEAEENGQRHFGHPAERRNDPAHPARGESHFAGRPEGRK